jgi:hypothetical protein
MVDPREIASHANFDEIAQRLAAGEDLTVVEPQYAALWSNSVRYPTAVTLVAMPSASGVGLVIVPFLDPVGEPGDEGVDSYAGVIYLLAVENTIFSFREYQRNEGPFEAALLGFSMMEPVDDKEWRTCSMIPYEDPAFVRATRFLRDRYAVREFPVYSQRRAAASPASPASA